MPRPGTNAFAASVARGIAVHQDSLEFGKLSSEICWDAVAHCLLLAGFKAPAVQLPSRPLLVNTRDPQILSAAAMGNVPEGHVIGFFTQKPGDSPIMYHQMIATGAGAAAGNKNSCIGIGSPVGWELLDLTTLNWQPGGRVVGDGGSDLSVHHRSPEGSLPIKSST